MIRRTYLLTMAFIFSVVVDQGATLAGPYTTDSMPNGMELISVNLPKVPLVTILLTFKAGSRTETQDLNGLTHVWEHMFFKGNKALPSEEAFEKRLRQLGVIHNGTTSIDSVRYFITLPSARTEEGIKFIADAISSPLLLEEDLKKERVVVLDEFDRNASNPGFLINRLTNRLMFGSESHRRYPLGRRDLIETIDKKKLMRIRSEVFVPQNAALIVSGDVDQPQTKKWVEKYFANWRAEKGWSAPKLNPIPAFNESTRVVAVEPEAQNVNISVHYRSPTVRYHEEDTIVADAYLLAINQATSRWRKELVDSGLALGADVGYFTEYETGVLSFEATCFAEKANEVEAKIISLIQASAKPGFFTQNALDNVVRIVGIDKKRESDSPSNFAQVLAFYWSVTGLNYYQSYLDKLGKVKLESLSTFAAKYAGNTSPRVVTLLMNDADLKKSKMQENASALLKSLKISRNDQ